MVLFARYEGDVIHKVANFQQLEELDDFREENHYGCVSAFTLHCRGEKLDSCIKDLFINNSPTSRRIDYEYSVGHVTSKGTEHTVTIYEIFTPTITCVPVVNCKDGKLVLMQKHFSKVESAGNVFPSIRTNKDLTEEQAAEQFKETGGSGFPPFTAKKVSAELPDEHQLFIMNIDFSTVEKTIAKGILNLSGYKVVDITSQIANPSRSFVQKMIDEQKILPPIYKDIIRELFVTLKG